MLDVWLALAGTLVLAAGVPIEQKRWLKDHSYAMENLTDIGARVYIDGEMYRTVCSCRPSLPAVDVNCFPAKVEIQYAGRFPGQIDPDRLIIDGDNLRRLIGDPADLRLVPIMQQYFSDVDGRSSDEILGTWGGDTGELLLGLAVLEANSGGPLLEKQISIFIRNFLQFRKAPYFYMMTDTNSVGYLETALEAEDIDLSNPPPELQGRIASLLADPRVHGCALIRGLLDKPDAFGVRKELVHKALVTLYKLMWDKWDRLGRRIKFYILHSEKVRKESAWVDFKVRGSCLEEGRTVLFPPYSNDVSIYVNHPDAVELYHKFVAAQINSLVGNTMSEEALMPQLQGKLIIWHRAIVESLPELKGLPKYTVFVDALQPDEQAQLDAAKKQPTDGA